MEGSTGISSGAADTHGQLRWSTGPKQSLWPRQHRHSREARLCPRRGAAAARPQATRGAQLLPNRASPRPYPECPKPAHTSPLQPAHTAQVGGTACPTGATAPPRQLGSAASHPSLLYSFTEEFSRFASHPSHTPWPRPCSPSRGQGSGPGGTGRRNTPERPAGLRPPTHGRQGRGSPAETATAGQAQLCRPRPEERQGCDSAALPGVLKPLLPPRRAHRKPGVSATGAAPGAPGPAALSGQTS